MSTGQPFLRSVPPLPKMDRMDEVRSIGFRELLMKMYEAQLATNEHLRQVLPELRGMALGARGVAESALGQAVAASQALNRRPDLPDVEITGTWDRLADRIEERQMVRDARRRDSWVKWLKRETLGHAVKFVVVGLLCALAGYLLKKVTP